MVTKYAEIGDTITFNDCYRGSYRKYTGIITSIVHRNYANDYLYLVKCGKVNRSYISTKQIEKS